MTSVTASASFAEASLGTPERSWLTAAWFEADESEFKENTDANNSSPALVLRKRSVQDIHQQEVAVLKQQLAEEKARSAGLTRELALRRAASPRATGSSSSSTREGLGATLAELSTELSAQKALAQTRLVELNGLRWVFAISFRVRKSLHHYFTHSRACFPLRVAT